MTAYVFDGAAPPLELLRAWDYARYSVNLLDLPIGELPLVRAVSNAHQALAGYKQATGHTAQWAAQNPETWAWVAEVLKERKERLEAQKHG